MASLDLDAELAALAQMDSKALAERWSALKGGPVPRVSAALLRLALAFELQAAVSGGVSRVAQQRLEQVAAAKTRTAPVRPGLRLAREWNGKVHVVTVSDDGVISWNGQTWTSLSQVARAITGTRWSGPAFFGLKHKSKAA